MQTNPVTSKNNLITCHILRRAPSHALVFASFFSLFSILGISAPARAVTTFVPTAGLAASSFVVGAIAATESALDETRSLWNRRLLGNGGLLLMGIDPDPAVYLEGTSVIRYPSSLLEYAGITWYGPFSDMSTGDTGPVAGPGAIQGSGFTDQVDVFRSQGPNSAIEFRVDDSAGVLTVEWAANPGIQAINGTSVNIFGFVFRNTSGTDLSISSLSPDSATANLFQDTAAQSLTCKPSGELIPRECGYPSEPIRFGVQTDVPGPVPLLGLAAAFGYSRKLRKRLKAGKCNYIQSVHDGDDGHDGPERR